MEKSVRQAMIDLAGGEDKFKAILAEVRLNRSKQENCPMHIFTKIPHKLGCKYTCIECGCEEVSSFVTGYEQGLKHGGELK